VIAFRPLTVKARRRLPLTLPLRGSFFLPASGGTVRGSGIDGRRAVLRNRKFTENSPSPPFRGEREGPRRASAGEGEVGDAANCLIGPPSPFPLPPAGGGRGVKSGLSEINFAGRQPPNFSPDTLAASGERVGVRGAARATFGAVAA